MDKKKLENLVDRLTSSYEDIAEELDSLKDQVEEVTYKLGFVGDLISDLCYFLDNDEC